MAERAAQRWQEVAASKANAKWMFDDYEFHDTCAYDRLKDMYIDDGLHMTGTLTLAEFLAPGEKNESLKSILIEIPLTLKQRIWEYMTIDGYAWRDVIKKHLEGVEAFGRLFGNRFAMTAIVKQDGCVSSRLVYYLVFDDKTIRDMGRSDIPVKRVGNKVTFILPINYVYPIEKSLRHH